MDSAFSYLQGLVDAFEDVGGNEQRTKRRSACVHQSTALPTCSVNAINCNTQVPNTHSDIEEQGSSIHEKRDKREEKLSTKRSRDGSNNIDLSESTRTPTPSKNPSFAGLVKSKSLEIASRMSLFQSFSDNDPYDIKKSGSSVSKTTADSNSDESGFEWAQSLSSNSDNSFDNNHGFVIDDALTKTSHKRNKKQRGRGRSGRHIELWSHGIIWTCMAISFGWCGLAFSYVSRKSINFVVLNDPMYLDPRYEKIESFGMIQIELCYNTTHLDILEELNDEPNPRPKDEPRDLSAEALLYEPENMIDVHDVAAHEYDESEIDGESNTPCIVHRLTSDDVRDDTLYVISQAAAFLSMVLGGFVTVCLTGSVFWKSINLRPIGAGYLVAYFLQSFTFLIFDSDICSSQNGCVMSRGGVLSAVASVCWIISCAASARMETRKLKNEAQQRRDLNQVEEKDEDEDFELMYQEHMLIMNKIQEDNRNKNASRIEGPRAKNDKRQKKKEPGQQTRFSLGKPEALSSRDRGRTEETAIISDDDNDGRSAMVSNEFQKSDVDRLTTTISPSRSVPVPPPPPPSELPRRPRKSKKKRPKDNSDNENPSPRKQQDHRRRYLQQENGSRTSSRKSNRPLDVTANDDLDRAYNDSVDAKSASIQKQDFLANADGLEPPSSGNPKANDWISFKDGKSNTPPQKAIAKDEIEKRRHPRQQHRSSRNRPRAKKEPSTTSHDDNKTRSKRGSSHKSFNEDKHYEL